MTRYDHRRWAERIAGEIKNLPAGATLVDLASGPGFLLVEIGKVVPGLNLVAQDQSELMLAIAKEEAAAAKLSVRTVCCPAESLSFDDDEADVVTCKQLLHEAQDPKKVVTEALRILKPQGRLFLIDFDANGSRLAAIAVRTMLRLSQGREIARDFWRSFKAGLHGEQVRARLIEVGFKNVDCRRSGFNYFITATKEGSV
jgi:ubiquinone/menaquinone biosynthesis C-methylase UbiE